jgi:hypothetical protein
MIQRFRGRILVVLAAVSFGVQTLPAYAATNGLSVGPFLQEVDLAEDQAESSFEITLGNNTKYTLPMLVSVVDFGAADDNGGVNFLPKVDDLSHKYGLASWMSTEKNNLIMAPHSAQQIKVNIQNKDSMSPGGHYGAVIFQLDRSQLTPDQTNVSFLKAVSTLVLAKKPGGGAADLKYSGMTWDGAPLALPSSVHIKLYNTGNIHTTPTGTMTLTNTLGQVVNTDKFNPDNSIILPETLRTYPISISHSPLQIIPGWATITLHYQVSANTPFRTVTERFFVFSPWSVVILIALIILVILCINYRIEIINVFRRLRGMPLLERKVRASKSIEK